MPLYIVGIKHDAKEEWFYEAYTNESDAQTRASEYFRDNNIIVSIEEYHSVGEMHGYGRLRVEQTKDSIIKYIKGT